MQEALKKMVELGVMGKRKQGHRDEYFLLDSVEVQSEPADEELEQLFSNDNDNF